MENQVSVDISCKMPYPAQVPSSAVVVAGLCQQLHWCPTGHGVASCEQSITSFDDIAPHANNQEHSRSLTLGDAPELLSMTGLVKKMTYSHDHTR